MSAESYFTEVVCSYRKLLLASEAESCALSLREYCRVRHVSWRDFQRWASTAEVAADLPIRSTKASPKIKSSGKKSLTCESPKETRVLYPLHFTPVTESGEEIRESESGLLHDICIRFPGGVMISIGRGSVREVSSLINFINFIKP
ncbi:MAG: hypothetical protein LBF05_02870 [Tannerella sp.]|jgi:hypothetical protein|nr:hypothetical protein [Tannerella sp.]